jgi:hypothetical protein
VDSVYVVTTVQHHSVNGLQICGGDEFLFLVTVSSQQQITITHFTVIKLLSGNANLNYCHCFYEGLPPGFVLTVVDSIMNINDHNFSGSQRLP